ncbi:MAG: hypothetical protein JSR60_11415 [Proteobacteria bacterium]|nr:hypothetical protein [Pseudomonadota bacterium]
MLRLLLVRLQSIKTLYLPLYGVILAIIVRLTASLILWPFVHQSFSIAVCFVVVPFMAAVGLGADLAGASFSRLICLAIPVDFCCGVFAGAFFYITANRRFGPPSPETLIEIGGIVAAIAICLSALCWYELRRELRK